jgi:hypothetical protein
LISPAANAHVAAATAFHFGPNTSYTSLPNIPSPSIHNSVTSFTQLESINESLQLLLRGQDTFFKLLQENQRQMDAAVKITREEFESKFPVGKVLLFRIIILTIYFAFQDKGYQFAPNSKLQPIDHSVLVKYAKQATTRILRSHSRKSYLPPDDGKFSFQHFHEQGPFLLTILSYRFIQSRFPGHNMGR